MDDLSEFPELAGNGKLRVKRDRLSGVWHIRLPKLFWKFAAAQEERNSLVARLVQKFPVAALWSGAGGDCTEPYVWSFPAASQLPRIVESLYEGAWTLFFFADDPQKRLQSISKVPSKAKDLKDLLSCISAGAAISSYYDDIEWTLVIADSDPS